ncbi:MAG: CRISPR-associated endonuclease Cas1 [Verrucomicrobiota bacterium]
MPTACLNQSDLQVRLRSERLAVYGRSEDGASETLVREIPLRDLDRLIVSDSVQFSGAAMGEILQRGIPIQVFSWNGRFLGNFLPAQNHHGFSRVAQYQRSLDAAFALQMAGRIVTAKLYNQRRVIQRLKLAREKSDGAPRTDLPDPLAATLTWLDCLFGSIRDSCTIDELRGYEGAATARYFQAWATFLPPAFPFERRSTRPPVNPVNACISFASTVLSNEAVAFCHAHGLDPALGLLHSTENGRWSLALDLIEPFRPALVEALALDLFSHQILNQGHFEQRDGGVLLNEEGRKKFFLQYERRMERQFMSESVGHRTTLRQQLETQAVMFKSALENPAAFEPFLIN